MSALIIVGVPLIVAWFAGWWLAAHIAKGAGHVGGISLPRDRDHVSGAGRYRALLAYFRSTVGAQRRTARRVLTYHQKVYAESHPRLHAMKTFMEAKR